MTVLARRVAGARDVFWAHPEWWVVCLGLFAWAPLVRHGTVSLRDAHHQDTSVAGELVSWLAMVVAMMLPILITKGRDVAFRSFAERRHRAIGLFLIGYLIPWSALGLLPAVINVATITHSRWPVAAAFAAATVWAMLPIRALGMVMSYGHTPLIAPAGGEADRDCVTSGLIVGSWCLVSCGPLMLACAMTGHQLLAMIGGAAIGIVESRSFRPPRTFVVVVSALLTAFFAVV